MTIDIIESKNTKEGMFTRLKVVNNNHKPVFSFRAEVEFLEEMEDL